MHKQSKKRYTENTSENVPTYIRVDGVDAYLESAALLKIEHKSGNL